MKKLLALLLAAMMLLGTGVTEFMIKLPPIAADIALSAVLYHFVKKELGSPAALALTILYAFSPLILATGAAWGQADALMTLLLLLVVIFAVKGCWKAAVLKNATVAFWSTSAMSAGWQMILLSSAVTGCRSAGQRKKLLCRRWLPTSAACKEARPCRFSLLFFPGSTDFPTAWSCLQPAFCSMSF